MVYKISFTRQDGKRTTFSKRFNTKSSAEKDKNKMLDAKKSAIKRKGRSALTGFNPRVIKVLK